MKRNNKVFLYMFLVTCVFVGITGCKKFLDRKPLSPTLTDYGSVLDGQAIGMYSIFDTWAGFNTREGWGIGGNATATEVPLP